MASSTDIEDFLNGPLVSWLKSCVEDIDNKLDNYENYFDGFPFRDVLLKIDPDPNEPIQSLSSFLYDVNIVTARIEIFQTILNHIQSIYLSELRQVPVSLPDVVILSKEPSSKSALDQLQLMILLLLGAAVQGPTRDFFVNKITGLTEDQQFGIVGCIQKITHTNQIVLNCETLPSTPELIYQPIQNLAQERNKWMTQWLNDVKKRSIEGNAWQDSDKDALAADATHLAVEIVEYKSQIRRLKQTIDERSDHILEITEELERVKLQNVKLQAENNKLNADIKKADRAQDEWDDLKDKAAKSESLEKEVITLRRSLIDAKSNRNRLDELLADKKVLERSLETLEIQLAEARKKAKGIFEAERKLLDSEKVINDLVLELDALKTKVQELEEQNQELQQVAKNNHENDLEEDGSFDTDDSRTYYDCSTGNTSIGEELNNNVQARALRLQLENRKLQILIDSLKQKNFYETGNQVLELEKEKKKLSLRCDKLQSECDRLREGNIAVENLFQKAIEENEKLQNNLDTLRISSDKQAHDLQIEMAKQEDLLQSIEHLQKEKEKVLTLIDSIKNRADKAEKSNGDLKETIEELKKDIAKSRQVERANEQLSEKIEMLERENSNLLKEVVKNKELLEVKSVDLDQKTDKIALLERQVEVLSKEKSEMMEQVEKLQDCERKAQELLSHAEMHAETISTLQKDLVTEKVNNEKFRSNVEKLGLSLDILENDINVVLEKMLDNLEISKALTAIYKTKDNGMLEEHLEEMASSLTEEWRQQVEKLEAEITALQSSKESLKTENATLQVDISTLNSQLQSLHMQQTALQLANSQLVAEKDDLSRQYIMQQNQHKALSHDQNILSNIHEELTAEYEKLRTEKEDLKKNNRDLKAEVGTFKEKLKSLENQIETLKQEKEKQTKDSSDLALLRDEHSKLRRDFRVVLTTNGQCYAELKCSREELSTLRTEFRELKAANAEMKSELDSKSDMISNFQLENAVLQQRCEMLQDNLNKLDLTRISLLDSFSELCKQSLVCMADSMDKQNVSQMEAKHHWEQYNNILRQKDKLEEKIFDFYKKLDNVNTKKGGFASLVRRVRKAGSGIMSRSRSNRRSSEEETPTRAVTAEPQVAGPSCSGSGESNNSSNGNESDNSTEDSILRAEPFRRAQHGGSLHGHKPRDEIALRRSQRQQSRRNSIASEEQLLRDSPSLGSIGSRRTVYISEDEPAPSPTPIIQSTPLRDTNPPLLVYNRISTVIGGDTLCTLGNQTNLPEIPRENLDSKKPANPKETAVWYEYGCV